MIRNPISYLRYLHEQSVAQTQLPHPTEQALQSITSNARTNRSLGSRVYELALLNRQLQLKKQVFNNLDIFKKLAPQPLPLQLLNGYKEALTKATLG